MVEDKGQSSKLDTSEEIKDSNIDNQIDDTFIIKNIKNFKSKNEQAKELLEHSKEIISKADKEVEVTKSSISKDIDRLQEIKNSFLNTTFTKSLILLEKASYEYNQKNSNEPFKFSLDNMNESINLQNISSGRFTGFILSLLTMLLVAVGWIYLAITNLGIKLQLQPPKIPDDETINRIFTWIGGGMTGANGNIIAGEATVAISALIFGFLVYKIYISLKENKNFKIANDIYKKSHQYLQKQKEIKNEIEKIDEHIKEVIPTLENYKYLLDEQNGKLARILHVEGIKEDYETYHPKSVETMRDTEKLMNRVQELISTPITKDGKLNEEAKFSLYEAKEVYEYFLSKIYD